MKVKDTRALYIFKSALNVLEGVYGDNEEFTGEELERAFNGAGIELTPSQEEALASICAEIVGELAGADYIEKRLKDRYEFTGDFPTFRVVPSKWKEMDDDMLVAVFDSFVDWGTRFEERMKEGIFGDGEENLVYRALQMEIRSRNLQRKCRNWR